MTPTHAAAHRWAPLWLGLTAAACLIPAPAAADAGCLPGLELSGVADLVNAVGPALLDRGVRTDGSDLGCGTARAELRRDADGLTVVLTAPDGTVEQRDLPNTDAAVIWLETMLRSDRYADLLGPRPGLPLEPAPTPDRSPAEPALVDASLDLERSPRVRRYSLELSPVLQLSPNSLRETMPAAAGGIELGACVWIGPVCTGLRAQALWQSQRWESELPLEDEELVPVSNLQRLGFYEILLSVRPGVQLRTRRGDLRVGPSVGLGLQVVSGRYGQEINEGEDLDDALFEIRDDKSTFRLEGGFALSWHPLPAVGLRFGITAGWSPGFSEKRAEDWMLTAKEWEEDDAESFEALTLPEADARMTLGVELRL